jgi:hypothetical protein
MTTPTGHDGQPATGSAPTEVPVHGGILGATAGLLEPLGEFFANADAAVRTRLGRFITGRQPDSVPSRGRGRHHHPEADRSRRPATRALQPHADTTGADPHLPTDKDHAVIPVATGTGHRGRNQTRSPSTFRPPTRPCARTADEMTNPTLSPAAALADGQ